MKIFVFAKGEIAEDDKWHIAQILCPRVATTGDIAIISNSYYSDPSNLVVELRDGDYVAAIIVSNRKKTRKTIIAGACNSLRSYLLKYPNRNSYEAIVEYDKEYTQHSAGN